MQTTDGGGTTPPPESILDDIDEDDDDHEDDPKDVPTIPLIIKATALQEMTNRALRQKGSPYRIGEISIAASIPPGVTFAIARLDDEPEAVDGLVVSSQDLVDQGQAGELVLALDGTMLDEAIADEIAAAADLARGKAEGVPVVVVRGLTLQGDGSAQEIVIEPELDLFR